MKTDQAAIAEFWDERASLEEQAGTRDLIAKQLEVEAIAKYVKDGMRVLDVGCGNGVTALELARRYDIDLVAVDSSKEMLSAAMDRCVGRVVKGSVKFRPADVLDLPDDLGMFDLIYTERVLINLPEQEQRNKAMVQICNRLRSGGIYVMCENSQDGLDGINRRRAQLDLPEIVPPWHNHYLSTDIDIDGFEKAVRGLAVHLWADDNDYSSTYYFLSRVVNAALAAEEGREPDYDSPINRLALKLPAMGDLGQGRIWLWRRL
jgi:ubiquinone/menaquinone biosynthesis C-methylase UbiE